MVFVVLLRTFFPLQLRRSEHLVRAFEDKARRSRLPTFPDLTLLGQAPCAAEVSKDAAELLGRGHSNGPPHCSPMNCEGAPLVLKL